MPYARKDLLTWQAGMYYHIYNRGVSKSTLFREPSNYLFVIEKLQKYRQAKSATVIAYCLMPNHYHLLLRQDGEEPAGDVPRLVFNSYSKAYNLKYAHSGTLFESRFHAKPVQTRSHLLHLCRYIHGNSVKDGLVADPADWGWSNYLEWIGERKGSLVDHEFIKEQFDNASEYKKFLFEYLKSRQLPDDVMKFLEELEK
ncbi:MAG: transposase [Chloroflexi bacterium]|nr:transposase [Chloroflexota bacterium]